MELFVYSVNKCYLHIMIQQQNNHFILPGETFTFKNASNYQWSVTVTSITEKSVFWIWSNMPNCKPMRESLNTFNKKIETILVNRFINN